ncbi:MAG: hypothetical protein WBY88_12080, partial [Desulfosarcina sp.]
GLDKVHMTSFQRHLGRPVQMAEARQVMAAHLAAILGVNLTAINPEQLYEKIELDACRSGPCPRN